MLVVGAVFHFGLPVVAPDIPPQYGNANLFRPWGGWTSTYMAVHPFGFAVVFVAVYRWLLARGGLESGWRGGFAFGSVVFAVGSLPVYLLVFASLQLSLEVIAIWVVQSACQYMAAGAVVGWITTAGVRCQ
jgi:hypothetical protein